MKTRESATLAGAGAILLWSALAVLTTATGAVPPLQLTAMTFAIGGSAGLAVLARRGETHSLRQRPAAWALGVGGLFLYHALYFAALRSAPPAEAGLVNYLWPLLIVLFSSLLPGERLRLRHVAGALIAFAGLLVLFARKGDGFASLTPGHALAFAAAFVWSGYSVASRRFAADVPSGAVAGFCLATAALAGVLHLVMERTVWPDGAAQWAALGLLGLGPGGAAFFLWDHGVKRGDIRLIGVLSYAAPVLSTLWLAAAGQAEAGWPLAVACGMIVAGAVAARGAETQKARRRAGP